MERKKTGGDNQKRSETSASGKQVARPKLHMKMLEAHG